MGFSPSELCSSRAAVRRLRRPCPLDVEKQTLRISTTPDPTAETVGSRRLKTRGLPPRLQGFAPHESQPQDNGCLDPCPRVALLGFLPPGCSPSLEWHGLHRASPHELRFPDRKRSKKLPFRVSLPVRLACLFRDCRPSWALPPHDHHKHLGWTRFGSHLLKLRGASPSPGRAIFEPSDLPGRSRL
jgi:hypothetical protein